MQQNFGIAVDKRQVSEESINLDKDEMDELFVSNKERLPDSVIVHTCSYNKEYEWIVGVLCDADNGDPLVLICLKNRTKVYEEDIKRKC